MLVPGCREARDVASAPDAAEVPRWALEEVVRMGSLDDPERSLTTIGEVRIAGDGRLFVAQRIDSRPPTFN